MLTLVLLASVVNITIYVIYIYKNSQTQLLINMLVSELKCDPALKCVKEINKKIKYSSFKRKCIYEIIE